MAERAYNLSRANVIKLSHGTPVNEGMSSNYQITDNTPQLLFLDPVNIIRRVIMPDPAKHIGSFFWVENTSLSIGILQIWDYLSAGQLGELKPGYRGAMVSDGATWRISISTPTGSAISGYEQTFTTGDWTVDNTGRPAGTIYQYIDINHDIGKQYVQIQCANMDSKKQFIPADIIYTDDNNARIWITGHAGGINMRVMIAG